MNEERVDDLEFIPDDLTAALYDFHREGYDQGLEDGYGDGYTMGHDNGHAEALHDGYYERFYRSPATIASILLSFTDFSGCSDERQKTIFGND